MKIKNPFKYTADYIKEVPDKFNKTFPGGGITATVVTLNVSSILFSTGILATGCIAGTVTCISLAFLYLKAPYRLKEIVLKHSALGGWVVDVALTAGLTIMGFTLGATMGVMGLFLGLNVSAMFSFLSWLAFKKGIITENEYLGKAKEPRMITVPVN